jgi:hypothetical protein
VNPLVFLSIITCNQENILVPTIEAALNQNFERLGIVFSDAG